MKRSLVEVGRIGCLALAIALSGPTAPIRAEEDRATAAKAATEAPASGPRLLNVDGEGLALEGYDPVAYFIDGRPERGDPKWQSSFGGATYRFASADHKARFDADPARHVPAFGGFCAYAASIDAVVSVDPTVFQIEDGRLLLQYDRRAYERFNADVRGNLTRADANWPGLVEKNGTPDGRPSAASRLRSLIGF